MQRWRLELSVFCGYFLHPFPFQKVTPVTWHEICLLQNNILILLGLYSTMVKETFLMLRFFHAYPAPLETDSCPLTSSNAVTPYQGSSLMASLSKFGQLKQNSLIGFLIIFRFWFKTHMTVTFSLNNTSDIFPKFMQVKWLFIGQGNSISTLGADSDSLCKLISCVSREERMTAIHCVYHLMLQAAFGFPGLQNKWAAMWMNPTYSNQHWCA